MATSLALSSLLDVHRLSPFLKTLPRRYLPHSRKIDRMTLRPLAQRLDMMSADWPISAMSVARRARWCCSITSFAYLRRDF